MPRKGVPLTPEHKAKLLAAAAARREQASTAIADRPAPVADPLRDLAALIVQATSRDAEEDKILSQFTELIQRIDFKRHPELREHPAMRGLIEKALDREVNVEAQPGRIAPGTIHGTGWNATAEPWTWQHVEFLRQQDPDGMFKLKTVDCVRTEVIIINGLQCWFPEGQTITWYAPWVDQYRQALRSERELTRHRQWLFKVGPWDPKIPVELQPPPDQDWLEDANAIRLRAEGDAGMYRPGMGWNPAVDGKRFIPGFGPAPELPPGEVPVTEAPAEANAV